MLKVENVTKKYGDLVAVNNLSFEVNDGEIFGLLGLNGAGKTTTFRMILGLLDDYDGNITINGDKINYDITDKIGFLTEERSLLTKLTVREQIIYYGVLKSMTEEKIDKKLDYWLKRFGISEYKNKKIKELSKGNQQKVQFISAIINEPKLLILDEPFSGLDPINVELFKEVILDLKKKGTSIIFSSHRMEHVELFCEKLVVLVKGKSVINGYLSDIKKDYKKKNIVVVGDYDYALEETLYLSNFGKKVYLVSSKSKFTNKVLFDEINRKENVEVLFNSKLEKIVGKDEVEKVLINSSFFEVSAVFFFIGLTPSTNFASRLGIINERGYIEVNDKMETKLEGIYAAGDVINKNLRQIVTAASDGAIAANQIIRYLDTKK